MFDGKQFGQEIVGIVKAHVEKTLAPLLAKIDALEKQIAALPVPKDGKDADVDEIAALAAASLLPDIMEVRSMVEALPAPVELPDIPAMIADAIEAAKPEPVDVKAMVEESILLKVDPQIAKLNSDIQAINPQIEAIGGAIGEEIAEHVGKAIAAIHPAPTADELKEFFKAHIGEEVAFAVAALPQAEKGKDADPAEVAALVTQEAERIIAGWERPKDGQDGAPGEKGADGIAGRDGLDAVKFFRDEHLNLIVTLSDGSIHTIGPIDGKDGEAGINGKDGAPGERGKDGADAVGFDDMDLVETEQGVMLRFTRGEVIKDFRLPIVTDRGVFKEGTEYRKGDGVTWGGSFWIAQDTTSDKPDSGKGWRLSVKRGRDGKDGIMKDPPKGGPVKVG